MKTYVLMTVFGLTSTGLAAQPSALKAIPAPLRDLKLGTLNFLHTTDTHGWHAGHLHEAQYGADWGDYIDFASRLREKIEADGNDLLIIDTGDRVEGNGLYDASNPTGKYTFPIFTQQPMDLITTGNHELYKKHSSEHDFEILAPAYGDAYISANINISDPATGKMVPMAKGFRKFTTKNQQIRTLAFGFLFDFNRNFNNTVVQPVERTLLEPWFNEALNDQELDLIIVIAHAAARSSELTAIHKAIRTVHPDLPLMFFAGHQHIRDYKIFDDKAHVLASGRFMETIGFQSIDGIQGRGGDGHKYKSTSDSKPLTYFRRYIDNNLYSYYHHTQTDASTFHTTKGQSVSAQIADARHTLKLDENFGCAPTDMWVSRVPFPSENSVLTWLNDTVLPEIVVNPARSDKARIILFNSGAMRFDIFKGAFTRDETFIVSPFTNGMHYIPDVPAEFAQAVSPLLNRFRTVIRDDGSRLEAWELVSPEQRFRRGSSVPSPHQDHTGDHTQQFVDDEPSTSGFKLMPGYTTSDDAGSDGDDTIHTPIASHRVPNIIQSYVAPSSSADATIDLVFNQYLNPYVLSALDSIAGKKYTAADVQDYMPGETMTGLVVKWVQKNWDKNC